MTTQIADPIQIEGQSLMTLPRSVSPNEGSPELDGYYCIFTDPFNCSCRTKPWRYLHYTKMIIVWPNNDDDSILQNAAEMKKLDTNPKIIEYKCMMGKAIPWDDIPMGETLA